MSILNAAMQQCRGRRPRQLPGPVVKPRTRALAGAGVLAAITATVGRF